MRPTHIAFAVLVTAVWGVNFVVIEVGLGHFPPLLFSALRFLAAALPAVFFVGRPKVAWKWVIGVGLVLGVAKFGLLFVGMDQGMPAGLSSLVLQIQAVFTALFAAVALGERPGRVRLLGMAVALAGIAVAAVDEGTSGPLLAFTLVIAAAACWGVSNVLTRKASPPDALNFMVWVSAVPVLPLLGLSLLFEGPDADLAALRALDGTGIAVILYVAWVTTVFGFGAWGFLLRRYPASSVAPFSLLVPVFGMSSAALLLSESVSPLRWCAAALLVGGVALTSLSRTGGPATPLPKPPLATEPVPAETVPAETVPAEPVPAEPVLGAPVSGEPIPAVSASTGWAPAEPTPAPSTAAANTPAANTPAANTPAGPLTPKSSPTRA
ncbi:membrane protein [Streptomyces scopuliridis RB72]|uniref:Membrane protein n=1 Tax=Streptomyces scopuliridis RB72 TaxID=1440053 RepID=A0A2T7T995_9ACTN|nr:EamA family transporter [Streptomyces scopuliridis]PVE11675.1 membrane protein [Streptomyces scopuliridis RB72]